MSGISWSELFIRAAEVVETKLIQERMQEKKLLLQPSTRPGSLLLLAIGLLWPHEVILDEKNILDDPEARRLCEDDLPQELLPPSALILADQDIERAGADLPGWRLILCTSGSTGEPKRIPKTGVGLLAEVQDLVPIYGPQTQLLSLVSPLHIYGLLHSFLLPWTLNCAVEFINFAAGPVDPAELSASAYSAVIAVPATWSFVKDLLVCKSLGLLVMSGAPFGERRRQELLELPQKPNEALEILGSTETGGLGFRSLLENVDYFKPLPSVTIRERDGFQEVISPYLLPENRWALADRLELRDDGCFWHRGRMDRIFKYAGQRYALGEVELALSRCFGNVEVYVRFHQDDGVAQGGWLEAWIEALDAGELRAARDFYRSLTLAPFPHRLQFWGQFPRDTQGKVQILSSLESDGRRI